MVAIVISQALALSGYGSKYYDMPLGTNPWFFQFLCGVLRGRLDTFPPDFIPPGYNNPEYKPTNRGLLVSIFGLTSLSVAVLVVLARLGTQSLRAAGGRIKMRNKIDEVTGKKDNSWAWEGGTGSEWWKPWKRYGLRFGKLGWDDWTMVIALILLAGYTTLNCLSVANGGMGKHVYDVSLSSVIYLLKTTFAHSILYLTLAFFIKLSILLFYLKLFPLTFTWMRRTIFCLIAFFFVYTIVGTTITCLVCKPVKAFWTLELRAGDSCPSQTEVQRRYLSILAIHVTGDFVVLMLPMHLISTLHLPKRQKIILVFIFSAGGLACIASILRLYYFPRINASLDVTWNVTYISLWGQVEASTAVICASIPSLKPLFSSLNKKRKSYQSTGTAGRGFLAGSRRHLPATSDMHSSSGSFIIPGLPSSRGTASSSTINTAHISSNREKNVSFSPTRNSQMNACAARHGARDVYEIILAEIDNIEDEVHLDEVKDGAHSSPSITITPPRSVHKSGQPRGKMGDLDDQRNVISATHSSNSPSPSSNIDSSQYLSVPKYPHPGQGHPRLQSRRTQFKESETTLVPTSSSKKSDSPCQSSTLKSSSTSTLPVLPVETYHNPGRPQHKEECSPPPLTTSIPYVYPPNCVLDTTGIDYAYYAVPKAPTMGYPKPSGARVEWGGWGNYDGAEMV